MRAFSSATCCSATIPTAGATAQKNSRELRIAYSRTLNRLAPNGQPCADGGCTLSTRCCWVLDLCYRCRCTESTRPFLTQGDRTLHLHRGPPAKESNSRALTFSGLPGPCCMRHGMRATSASPVHGKVGVGDLSCAVMVCCVSWPRRHKEEQPAWLRRTLKNSDEYLRTLNRLATKCSALQGDWPSFDTILLGFEVVLQMQLH